MIDVGLWFMFPVAVAIAATAMMAGIGGAVLFAPFFMLVLRLDPVLALGAGLVIEFFGFSSGVIGYLRKRTTCCPVVERLVVLTVPATVAGVILGELTPAFVLQSMLAALLAYLSFQFLKPGKECLPKHPLATGHDPVEGGASLVTPLVRATSLLGGLLVGMISAGLGEMNEYNFLRRMRLPVAAASATSVFLVATSATAGAGIHAYYLVSASEASAFADVISLLVFTVPGVIIGGQVGVRLAGLINARLMARIVGVLFVVLGVLTLLLVLWGRSGTA
jgi:hypothetical protein